jgi:lipid II:glycine glycyltransferase (peptidoglycan interpeptide bridge formation enzyme)
MTYLKITKVINAPQDVWADIYDSCAYATYFHSPQFSKLLTTYNPLIQPDTVLIEFNDNQKAIFILHGEKSFKGLIKFNVSSMFGVYGGWISDTPLTEQHHNLLLNYAQSINVTIRVNPYDTSTPFKNAVVKHEFTQILNLKKDYDALHQNYEYRHKYAIRKAVEKGVIFKEAWLIADWEEYYQVYLNSIARWGNKTRSSYKWPLFDALYNSGAKLYMAVLNDKIIAGAVCFADKGKIIYWHGAYLEEYKHANASTFLIDGIIKTHAEEFDYFDFMPSGGLENVIKFKKGFSPVFVDTPVFSNFTTGYTAKLKFLNKLRNLITLKF